MLISDEVRLTSEVIFGLKVSHLPLKSFIELKQSNPSLNIIIMCLLFLSYSHDE